MARLPLRHKPVRSCSREHWLGSVGTENPKPSKQHVHMSSHSKDGCSRERGLIVGSLNKGTGGNHKSISQRSLRVAFLRVLEWAEVWKWLISGRGQGKVMGQEEEAAVFSR